MSVPRVLQPSTRPCLEDGPHGEGAMEVGSRTGGYCSTQLTPSGSETEGAARTNFPLPSEDDHSTLQPPLGPRGRQGTGATAAGQGASTGWLSTTQRLLVPQLDPAWSTTALSGRGQAAGA